MCGINALYYRDGSRLIDRHVLNRMRQVAIHRGPDDHGIYLRHNVGLAFNRLSIIDLAGGHQPMANEDGTVWVVFNGEIYNFKALHDELTGRGHRFQTRSDTEVIVHAWEEYGEECVRKLRGMFAFIIWDDRRKILFGARDRLGIKPFYYYADEHQVGFASELKSLLEIPGVPTDLDEAAIGEYLQRRYVIAPNTMLKGIRKLPPGHSISVSERGISITRYWDLPSGPVQNISERDALDQLDFLLLDTTRLHLVADVPLGAFLSGGLDSSCIVGLMHRLDVRDIKTFSIGYDSPESELAYARIVADHFHTDHHELRLTCLDFRDTLPKIAWHMDEPVGDTASIPLFYLSQFARQQVTVVLSGEGSDEIFGGYPIYRRMLAFERANRVPLLSAFGRAVGALAGDTKIRKYANMLGDPVEKRYGGVGGLFSHEQASRMFAGMGNSYDGVSAAYARAGTRSPFGRMSYVDHTTWLPDDLLVKADRMTMAHSLELRVPFLDHVMVEFAAGLPESLKIHRNISKYVIKRWAERLLPRSIVHRPKKGFPVPTKVWFRQELSGFLRDALFASDSVCRKYFAKQELERLLKAHEIEDRSEQIYSLLVLDSWSRQFVRHAVEPQHTPVPV
jgi:asparagine synthase (glutamine-hydrolysing)